jgi:hypothetical protein
MLGRITGLKGPELEALLRDAPTLYKKRLEPKPTGGFRLIQAPRRPLKLAQRSVLQWLYKNTKVHGAATAGFKGASILRHARFHLGRKYVLTMDLKSFFDNVNYGQVKQALTRNGIEAELAALITRLCTRMRALPQGAPTSPYLGNLVLFGLDRRIARCARRHGAKYSRYIDDLAISSDQSLDMLRPWVEQAIVRAGFRVSAHKTVLQSAPHEQVITGIEVSHGLTIPQARLAGIEQRIRGLVAGEKLPRTTQKRVRLRNSLNGHVSFVRMVNRLEGDRLLVLLKDVDWHG